ncbi:PLAC8 family protein [Striga asiatica]|uniref:PLAC8 family protein n=1 Tax=Striga asiatica TaxID=4170 RepID=A0A5A7PPU1_STRAF|nr:PLAC8 family protein [Striga asiatica]
MVEQISWPRWILKPEKDSIFKRGGEKMSSWEHFGEIANVAQLTGIDAVKLIGMIVQAASTARMHKENCRQFAQHLKLIGNLLEPLRISELRNYPETREPIELLEDALRRSYVLVNSCRDRSYLYLLAMGWNIVYQFRKAQSEIDRYLKIIPLIALVNSARVQERLEMIEKDQQEYTLNDEDQEVLDVILRREPLQHDMIFLQKTLSCSYPDMPIKEAVKKENEKLQVELQYSQSNMDVGQSEVIRYLLEVMETFAEAPFPEDSVIVKQSKVEYDKNSSENTEKQAASGKMSSVSFKQNLRSSEGSIDEWHSDLLGCCSEPLLCLKTMLFPCGTFSRIASVATKRHISSADACNDLMAYSLIFSCCCYTFYVRRKLRTTLNIKGGLFVDFLAHLMCCCCALVQEWREIEARQFKGPHVTRTSPPTIQYIEY